MEEWLGAARSNLIQSGIHAVKVDLLAARLGVTRGGFYHKFSSRDELLRLLLADWEDSCDFLPEEPFEATPGGAAQWLDRFYHRHTIGFGYDHSFDLAVREWARSDRLAAYSVERVDRRRLAMIQLCFETLGLSRLEATARSRLIYQHQLGFYMIGLHGRPSQYQRDLMECLKILQGSTLPWRACSGDRHYLEH